jgi:hypothetical protein
MLLEIVFRAEDSLISRQVRVVLERSDDVECHLDLKNALVQIHVRTLGMKSCSSRDNVFLSRCYRAFGAVGIFHVGRYQLHPQPKGVGHCDEWLA